MTWLARLLVEWPGVIVMGQPAVEGLVVTGAQESAQGAQCAPVHFDPTLEALCVGLPPEDAQALREERAGILEFEAGMTPANAARMAGLHAGTHARKSA